MQVQAARRIMVVGQPGSGKSTLARTLGGAPGLQVYHIDQIIWSEGWVERPAQARAALCAEIEAKENWVFDGNHSATWTSRLARAEVLVWIDLPLWRRAFRIARRTVLQLGQVRPDMAPGCPERLGRNAWEFWAYIWRTRASGRARTATLAATAGAAGKTVVTLGSVAEVDAFVMTLPK